MAAAGRRLLYISGEKEQVGSKLLRGSLRWPQPSLCDVWHKLGDSKKSFFSALREFQPHKKIIPGLEST